jgi:hypothetical protein
MQVLTTAQCRLLGLARELAHVLTTALTLERLRTRALDLTKPHELLLLVPKGERISLALLGLAPLRMQVLGFSLLGVEESLQPARLALVCVERRVALPLCMQVLGFSL